MNHKPIGGVSVHHSRSQMLMVKAMTITVDSLPPRPKLDCDASYDVAMKGASVVVRQRTTTEAAAQSTSSDGGAAPNPPTSSTQKDPLSHGVTARWGT